MRILGIVSSHPLISLAPSSFLPSSPPQVPDILPHAWRGAEDRAADGGVQPAVLPVQPRPRGQAALNHRHRLHPRLRHHPPQHGPTHAQPQAGEGRKQLRRRGGTFSQLFSFPSHFLHFCRVNTRDDANTYLNPKFLAGKALLRSVPAVCSIIHNRPGQHYNT